MCGGGYAGGTDKGRGGELSFSRKRADVVSFRRTSTSGEEGRALACWAEGMGRGCPALSPRPSCSDCGVLPGTGCCMCCNVCVPCVRMQCISQTLTHTYHTQRRSPMMRGLGGDAWRMTAGHHSLSPRRKQRYCVAACWQVTHAHFFLSLFLWWCLWPWPCLWWCPLLEVVAPEPAADVGS